MTRPIAAKNLISKIANIELYNLKGICPFLYKINDNFEEIKSNFVIHNDNEFRYNNVVLPLNRLYFKDGYNKNISLTDYLSEKYNTKYDDKILQ
tara:strand:+ start:449 stop:730 length:282 start_codon:yes stop_codon:yes gene_type:complete